MPGPHKKISLNERSDDVDKIETYSKYCLILEGLTEFEYFDWIKKKDLCKKDGPELDFILKTNTIDQDESDRKQMVCMAYSDRLYANNGTPTLDLYVSKFMNKIYSNYVGPDDNKKCNLPRKCVRKILSDCRKIILDSDLNNASEKYEIKNNTDPMLKKSGIVDPQKNIMRPGIDKIVYGSGKSLLEQLIKTTKDILSDYENKSNDMWNKIMESKRVFISPIANYCENAESYIDDDKFCNPAEEKAIDEPEKVCVVFDRDYNESPDMHKNRDCAYYSVVIDMCSVLNYDPIVSTPLFELWLLLHNNRLKLDECNFYYKNKNTVLTPLDQFELEEYRVLQKDKEFSEDATKKIAMMEKVIELKKIIRADPSNVVAKKELSQYNYDLKRMDKCRFKIYRKSITTAIANSKKIPPLNTDVVELNTNVGSNIGFLLEKILKKKFLPSPNGV